MVLLSLEKRTYQVQKHRLRIQERRTDHGHRASDAVFDAKIMTMIVW